MNEIMSDDWEKLAGERGEEIPSSRFGRMFELGKMSAKVSASMLAHKASSFLTGKQDDVLQEEVFRANAARVVEVLGKLKGASMKVGQLLSADPELMPDGFGEHLSSLQNSAPPMTYVTVKRQIEEAFDRPIELIFREFDPDPIGAASIGQVHYAVLDSGEKVAVKIQYPGVIEALESDLKSVANMMSYGRAMVEKERLNAYMNEIRETVIQEADYEDEGRKLQHFHELFAQREGVRVPRPYMEWTRKNVLVMEYVKGTKFDDALLAMEPEQRKPYLRLWVETYTWMFHERFELHADPHPGNFLLEEDGTLVILDFGSVKRFDEAFADGMLRLIDTCWSGDHEEAKKIYIELGFGASTLNWDRIDPQLLADYHDIVLRPFLRDEPFAFRDWKPAGESREFMLSHPAFLKLVPPAQALPYFRMLSGVKGLLIRLDAELNVYELAYEAAKRRGVLTSP